MISFLMNILGVNKLLSYLIAIISISGIIITTLGGIYFYGKSVGKAECNNAVLEATIKEQQRQLKEAEKIIENDAKKALENSVELEKLKELVDNTPTNKQKCLDEETVNRIFNIK